MCLITFDIFLVQKIDFEHVTRHYSKQAHIHNKKSIRNTSVFFFLFCSFVDLRLYRYFFFFDFAFFPFLIFSRSFSLHFFCFAQIVLLFSFPPFLSLSVSLLSSHHNIGDEVLLLLKHSSNLFFCICIIGTI